MEEPLEQEHSINNDDIKPSSSSTTTNKSSSRSSKPTTSNGTTRRHKRRRKTNSIRSSSDHSSSSSRSSSTSSSHSSHSSNNDQESKKTRSCLAQEQLQSIVEKTKTGKFDILDGFAFLSFETDDDWRISFEYFQQQQRTLANKKSFALSNKKNGNLAEHLDGHSLHRSISVPCKIEDASRISHMPSSAPVDDTSTDSHRSSSMWQNSSPNKNSTDRPPLTTVKTEPTNRSSRTTSEHDESQFDIEYIPNSILASRNSTDDLKSESHEKKHRHHHHHHHHKRHKTKHDLSINGDSNKHPTITSMSDLAKQHMKHEAMPLPPSFNFPPPFDPKLFPLPTYPPFATPHPPHASPVPPSFPGSFDHPLMLASRLYGGPYPRDLPMPPPPRPPSRSLQHSFSLKENHPESMEKMFEKYYPGVLPGYLAAAAAAASTSSNSPVSSLNIKMHGASPNGPDHPLWSHRDALQRQFLAASNKSSSTKSPLFDSNSKLPPNHSGPSPTDRHHHHDRRHSSSTSMNDIPNPTTPTGHPLYLAPVIVTEFHQHQHNHNHTHEHKLNISTKDDRQSSPRSKTPLSNETKKPKSSFSVTDMFIDKPSLLSKHSPSQQQQSQGFLSVVSNKKENHSSPVIPLKKPSNGKWSTAHVHIAWMIYHHEQRQREKGNSLNSTNKIRPSTNFLPPPSSSSSHPTFLPPPLPLLDSNNDLSLLRPPMPSPFSFPFDINSSSNHLFRPPSTTKLPRPMVTSVSSSSSSSSSSAAIKTPTIKREQKTPFIDDRSRRTSPSPLSRPTSRTNIPPSSPSHRMRMDYSSLLLPPPSAAPHQFSPFSLNDDRKRFITPNTDLLHPFGPPPPPGASSFLSSLFPMNAPPIPPPPLISSSRRSGLPNDSSKSSSSSSLFPPPPSTPFDFTRPSLLPPGIPPLPNNHFESDRYRFLLEQQAREREFQLAMMSAATSGGAPPPPLFTDPSSSALFKHF